MPVEKCMRCGGSILAYNDCGRVERRCILCARTPNRGEPKAPHPIDAPTIRKAREMVEKHGFSADAAAQWLKVPVSEVRKAVHGAA